MELICALQNNATTLAKNAEEFCKRIDCLKKNGFSADVTTKELIKTCDEIGRLNDAIKAELNKIADENQTK